MPKIHASAVVYTGAQLAPDIEIGPGCVIGPRVRLGAGVRLGPHVVIDGETEIGERTVVYAHAVLGGPAQYRADAGEGARLKIGAGNVIREYVTMNTGTAKGGGLTEIGDDGYFMAYSHVGHDCHVGSKVTFANGVALGGHCHIADGVNLGGLVAVLQFVRIGRNAFVTGLTGVAADVIPYGMVRGDRGPRGALEGFNLIGLKRSGVPRERIYALRAAFRTIFLGAGRFEDRVREAQRRWPDSPEVVEVVEFILADTKRPICTPVQGASTSDEE